MTDKLDIHTVLKYAFFLENRASKTSRNINGASHSNVIPPQTISDWFANFEITN